MARRATTLIASSFAPHPPSSSTSTSTSAVAQRRRLLSPRPSATATAEATTTATALASSTASREEQEDREEKQKLFLLQKQRDAAAISRILELVSSPSSGPRGSKGLSPTSASEFDAAVATLESSPRGIKDPASSPLLSGRWKLLFTTRPGTSSPIQRAFTGVEAFSVHQEVTRAVVSRDDGQTRIPGSVANVVTLAGAGTLRVEASTSTAAAPLPGFTPRRGPGAWFLKFLGTSSVAPPRTPGQRLDFAFRRAAFFFTSGPLKGAAVPYPVPFEALSKLPGDLGDEVKGFLDTTFLSPDGDFRLSRGNKGTLFVLQRDDGTKKRLMDARELALTAGEVEACAAELRASGAGERSPLAGSRLSLGRWRLVWSEQSPDAAPLQRALAGRVSNWQVIGGGGRGGGGDALSNVVALLPGGALDVVATATCRPDSSNADRTLVDIDGLELRTLGGKARLLRIERSARTESDSGPAFFPESRRRKGSESGKKARSGSSSRRGGSAAAAAANKQRSNSSSKKKKEDNVGFVDWLYLDADVRVTRGSKGSLFVHVRDDDV